MLLTQWVRMQSDTALARWSTDSTLRRDLAARNWNLSAATKMLRNTLEWWVPYWAFSQHAKCFYDLWSTSHNSYCRKLFSSEIGKVRRAWYHRPTRAPLSGQHKLHVSWALLSRRRTYKPHDIRWADIATEATGKQFVMPDREDRQIVIMRPR